MYRLNWMVTTLTQEAPRSYHRFAYQIPIVSRDASGTKGCDGRSTCWPTNQSHWVSDPANCENAGFKTIKNLAGHGLGRSLHEEPEGIVSYFDRRDTRKLQLGQVIAIEPFLSTISTQVDETDDGWTLVGHPDNLSAQFEHTLIITRGFPIVATI